MPVTRPRSGQPTGHGYGSARLVVDVALIGPWAKIAGEVQRWKQTVLTTFSIHCDPDQLGRITTRLTARSASPAARSPGPGWRRR